MDMMVKSHRSFDIERFNTLITRHRQAQLDLISCDSEDEDEIDRLSDIAFASGEAILAAPAPTIEALAAKLELLASDTQWGQELVNSVVADGLRLAGIQHTPAFVPEVWLHSFQRLGGSIGRHGDKPTLSAPVETCAASAMIRDLTAWQRSAIVEHLNNLIDTQEC